MMATQGEQETMEIYTTAALRRRDTLALSIPESILNHASRYAIALFASYATLKRG